MSHNIKELKKKKRLPRWMWIWSCSEQQSRNGNRKTERFVTHPKKKINKKKTVKRIINYLWFSNLGGKWIMCP